MAPEHSETTIAVSRSLVLCLSLIIYTSPVFADEPNDLYNQLALSNPKNTHSSAASRLSDMLNRRDSLSDTLSQAPAAGSTEPNNEAPFATNAQIKRVFCNTFSGCGGKFRSRRISRRRHVLSKRPFCNTYGCYNSGRKRSSQTPVANNHETSQAQDQKVVTFVDDWPWIRIKKLFCNGYGGCQNMGKRLQIRTEGDDSKLITNGHPMSLASEGGDSKPITSGHSISLPFSKQSTDSVDGKKRYFTSDFEDDMDSLIDSMRR